MKILLNGFSGRMGKAVLEVASGGYMNSEVVAGVDIVPCENEVPCYQSFSDVKENADWLLTNSL